MSIDIDGARAFMAGHGRLLDRRRFDIVADDSSAVGRAAGRTAVLAALDGYRNPDGGYGFGLEPDLRAVESQPGGAQHAFEAMVAAAPARSEHAVALCDWLGAVTLPDGGLPFALPIADPTACAPFWAGADPTTSSLQITSIIAANAHLVARSDPAVAAHPWLARVTRHCLDAIRGIGEAPFAYVLTFALRFLDAASDTVPEAHDLIGHLGRYVPSDGAVAVVGGKEGETLHLLDYAPEPGRPVRALVSEDAIAADLDRLENAQQPDGGWMVDFASYSPAAALEWRGYATVSAVMTLRLNGR